MQLFDGDPWHDAVALHRRLAYVPGDTNLWPTLTGGEVIDLLGDLRGGLDPTRRAELVDRFDLDPRKKARSYSKGNRQKVALIAALASDAELLVLDEPTAGLDPLMEAVFQDCIEDARAEGRTTLLSSHILDQVERLCDRVTIIRQGRAVESGTLDELRHLTRTTVVAETRQDPAVLDDLESVHDLQIARGRVSFSVDSTHLEAAVRRLAELGVTSLVSHPPTLEELFLRHYGDELDHAGVNGDHDHATAGAPTDERAPRPPDRRRRPVVSTVAGTSPRPVEDAAGAAATTGRARPSGGSTLTGTLRLTRFVLRRDRVRLTVWLVALIGFLVISGASLPPVYPDQAAIDSYVRLFGDNPALIAFAGPGYGFDDPNIGVILVNETQLWGMIAIALMSIFLLNRHTRAEEDDERTDLLRASVVGRHAPSAAAMGVVSAANVVVGVGCAIGFIALDYPVAGSIALAGSFTVVGLVFVGVTAVAAQVASTGRATLGLASIVLGVAFAVRALGDIGDNALRWLSPIGWAQKVRAFAGEQWWALGLCLALALALAVLGFWLSTRRDPGSGLVPTRPGPAHGSALLGRPLGLAVRLQRASVLGWTLGVLAVGVVYGSIGDEIEAMVEENPTMADFMAQAGGSLTDSYFATSLSMLGILTAGFAIASVLRLRTEEGDGRAESVLAGPVARSRWAAGHLTVAAAGSALVMAAAGLGVGVAYAAIVDDAQPGLAPARRRARGGPRRVGAAGHRRRRLRPGPPLGAGVVGGAGRGRGRVDVRHAAAPPDLDPGPVALRPRAPGPGPAGGVAAPGGAHRGGRRAHRRRPVGPAPARPARRVALRGGPRAPDLQDRCAPGAPP